MVYFKIIENAFISSVGTYDGTLESPVCTEINEEEFSEILSVIRNKPPRTETTDYRLREDLTWEEYPVDPPDPDPEIEDAEVYDILFGGAE